MKTIKMRKWVEVVLGIIMIAGIIVIASDCEDYTTFVASKMIAVSIMIPVGLLLEKYGR